MNVLDNFDFNGLSEEALKAKELILTYAEGYGELFRNLLDYHKGDVYRAVDAIENKSLGENGDNYYTIHTKECVHIFKR